jgi:hypothetical protein
LRFFFYLETGSSYVAQVGLKLAVWSRLLLHPPPRHWECRDVLPCLAQLYLGVRV